MHFKDSKISNIE